MAFPPVGGGACFSALRGGATAFQKRVGAPPAEQHPRASPFATTRLRSRSPFPGHLGPLGVMRKMEGVGRSLSSSSGLGATPTDQVLVGAPPPVEDLVSQCERGARQERGSSSSGGGGTSGAGAPDHTSTTTTLQQVYTTPDTLRARHKPVLGCSASASSGINFPPAGADVIHQEQFSASRSTYSLLAEVGIVGGPPVENHEGTERTVNPSHRSAHQATPGRTSAGPVSNSHSSIPPHQRFVPSSAHKRGGYELSSSAKLSTSSGPSQAPSLAEENQRLWVQLAEQNRQIERLRITTGYITKNGFS